MTNQKFRLTAVSLGGIVALMLSQTASAANSARLYWDGNGHYYQRFETGGIVWDDAKKACEKLSAHLATITSQEEQTFVQTTVLPTPTSTEYDYHIGGTDAATQMNFKWITGEPWSFENWGSGYPDNGADRDYLAIISYSGSGWNGAWYDIKPTWALTGYICEWSTQNYVDTALVPDLNGDGVDEIAGLFVNYRNGQHTVQIKDPVTDKLVSTLTFAKNFNPPQGLVVLKDIDGNNVPEIGVLFTAQGYPNVTIKDAKNNAAVLNSINYLTPAYKPRAVHASPDANGSSQIVVLGVHKATGKALAEVRDSKTGVKSADTPF